jgi:hypothetical protein
MAMRHLSISSSICCSWTAKTSQRYLWWIAKPGSKLFLVGAPDAIRYSDHQIGHGPEFHRLACQHGLEGIVSKRLDGRYEPDRRSWLKTKCLNR